MKIDGFPISFVPAAPASSLDQRRTESDREPRHRERESAERDGAKGSDEPQPDGVRATAPLALVEIMRGLIGSVHTLSSPGAATTPKDQETLTVAGCLRTRDAMEVPFTATIQRNREAAVVEVRFHVEGGPLTFDFDGDAAELFDTQIVLSLVAEHATSEGSDAEAGEAQRHFNIVV